MDGDSIIAWNPENWLTVVLMAFLAFAALSLAGALWRKYMPGSSAQYTGNVVPFMRAG